MTARHLLVSLWVSLVLLTGCLPGHNPTTDPAGYAGTSSAGIAGGADVRFAVRLDEAPATPSRQPVPEAAIRAAAGTVVRFELITIRPTDALNPTTIRATDVVAIGDTASAHFTDVPIAPTLARITIASGSVANATAFRGALDLSAGPNTIVVNPKGSRLSRDVLAAAVEAVIANPTVLALSGTGLVGRLETLVATLDRSSAAVYQTVGDLAVQHVAMPPSTLSQATALRLSVAVASAAFGGWQPNPAASGDRLRGGVIDAAGNTYFAHNTRNVIVRLTPDGRFDVFAGTVDTPGWVDGMGVAAQLSGPLDVAIDGTGNFMVPEIYRIRRVSSAGAVSWLAGTPYRTTPTGLVEGAEVPLAQVYSLVVGPTGDAAVCEPSANVIRRVTAAGQITTLGGAFNQSGHVDGAAAASRFYGPTDAAYDGSGRLYVTDTGNHCIRRIAADGTVSTLAGQPGDAGLGVVDGTGSLARLYAPELITTDTNGNSVVLDNGTSSKALRLVTADGAVRTLAGNLNDQSAWCNGVGAEARLAQVQDIWFDRSGQLRLLERWWNGNTAYYFIRAAEPVFGTAQPDVKLRVTALAGRSTTPVDLRPMLQHPVPPKIYVAFEENGVAQRVPLRTLTAGDFDDKGVVNSLVTVSGALRGRARAGELSLEVSDDKGPVLSRYVKAPASATLATEIPVQVDAITTAKALVYAEARRTQPTLFADIDDFDRKGPVTLARTIFPNADANSTVERVHQSATKYVLNQQLNNTAGYVANAQSLITKVQSDVFVGKYGDPVTSAQPDAFGVDDITIGNYLGGTAAPPVFALQIATLAADIFSGAQVYSGRGFAIDAAGTVFVTNRYSVNRLGTDGRLSIVAGTDGYVLENPIEYLSAIAHAGDGSFYMLDRSGGQLRHLAVGATVTTVSEGSFPANSCQDLAVAPDGAIFVASPYALMRRQGAASFTVLAGSAPLPGGVFEGGAIDGPGATARFGAPDGGLTSLAIDATGQVFVGDAGNNCIRKVTADGTVSTWIGHLGGSAPTGWDPGAAPWSRTAVYLYRPTDLAITNDGALFFNENSRMLRCAPDGTLLRVSLSFPGGVPYIGGLGPLRAHPTGGLVMMAATNETPAKYHLYRLTAPAP